MSRMGCGVAEARVPSFKVPHRRDGRCMSEPLLPPRTSKHSLRTIRDRLAHDAMQ
jgi:hypothetical protein